MNRMLIATSAFVAISLGTVNAQTVGRGSDGFDRTIRVCNNSGGGWSSRIVHVYATHVDRDDWGDDRLDGHISVGDCRNINPGGVQGYCMIDFRAVDASGREATRTLNACEESAWNIRRMN
jgi:hypothetical protein